MPTVHCAMKVASTLIIFYSPFWGSAMHISVSGTGCQDVAMIEFSWRRCSKDVSCDDRLTIEASVHLSVVVDA